MGLWPERIFVASPVINMLFYIRYATIFSHWSRWYKYKPLMQEVAPEPEQPHGGVIH
jgi:hypothetical protein